MFETFALAARDEEGRPLFNEINKHQIREQWDFAIVSRVVDQMKLLDQIFRGGEETKKD